MVSFFALIFLFLLLTPMLSSGPIAPPLDPKGLGDEKKEKYDAAMDLLKADDFLRPSSNFDVSGLKGQIINDAKNRSAGSRKT